MWPSIEADVLGSYAKASIDPAVYSEAAIFKAAYWATDRSYVFLDKDSDGRWLVEIRSKSPSDEQLQQALADFCNSLIDFRLRDIVNAETGAIREALVRRAFMEGIPKVGLEGAISNEAHIAPAPK
jgi:His-Xaa-Ser system protein HxsD